MATVSEPNLQDHQTKTKWKEKRITNNVAVPEIRGNPKFASTKRGGQKLTIISSASERGSRCQRSRSRGRKGKGKPVLTPTAAKRQTKGTRILKVDQIKEETLQQDGSF